MHCERQGIIRCGRNPGNTGLPGRKAEKNHHKLLVPLPVWLDTTSREPPPDAGAARGVIQNTSVRQIDFGRTTDRTKDAEQHRLLTPGPRSQVAATERPQQDRHPKTSTPGAARTLPQAMRHRLFVRGNGRISVVVSGFLGR